MLKKGCRKTAFFYKRLSSEFYQAFLYKAVLRLSLTSNLLYKVFTLIFKEL